MAANNSSPAEKADQYTAPQNAPDSLGSVDNGDNVDNGESPLSRPPLTDSPWFWAYLFCVFAAGALIMFGSRLGDRQSQLDEKAFNRQQSAATAIDSGSAVTSASEASNNAPAAPGSQHAKPIHLPFLPLLAVFFLLTIAGGVGLWWTHFYR